MTAALPADDLAEHLAEHLADSQFDYPGQAHGWCCYALNAANEFTPMQPLPASAASATPLAYLVCDDPHARIGRDALHAGYERRPCIQWHPREAGAYRITGEVALMNSRAAGSVKLRVIVDDVELLVKDLAYPQVLDFEIEVGVRAGGFVRLLFACNGCIDNTEMLYYVRAGRAGGEMPPGVYRATHRCEVPAAWQRLGEYLGRWPDDAPQDLALVAQRLFQPFGQADPRLLQMLQAGAQQRFHSKLETYRKPRFFSIQAAT